MTITLHAFDRAKERLSWDNEALKHTAAKAFVDGLTHSQAKGRLRKYVDGLWLQYKSANNIKIYGEVVFFFRNETLITVYQLPNQFKKLFNKLKQK